MKEEIIIAGFGGQGVLSMGKILAYSGIMQNLEVTWMPSYGPEMRGGTANVTVILSDKKISSPILTTYDTVIALNQQSLDKFESRVKPGGLLIYDPNGITHLPTRKDITVCSIAAVDVAAELGSAKVYNMVVLGALLQMKPIVEMENVTKGLMKSIPERYHNLIPMNEAAIEKGKQSIQILNRIQDSYGDIKTYPIFEAGAGNRARFHVRFNGKPWPNRPIPPYSSKTFFQFAFFY